MDIGQPKRVWEVEPLEAPAEQPQIPDPPPERPEPSRPPIEPVPDREPKEPVPAE